MCLRQTSAVTRQARAISTPRNRFPPVSRLRGENDVTRPDKQREVKKTQDKNVSGAKSCRAVVLPGGINGVRDGHDGHENHASRARGRIHGARDDDPNDGARLSDVPRLRSR